jgi:hypothetical protein
MASETLVKCAHPPCQCLLEAEQRFCSASCSNRRATASVPCSCGHPGGVAEQWAHDDIVDSDESDTLSIN